MHIISPLIFTGVALATTAVTSVPLISIENQETDYKVVGIANVPIVNAAVQTVGSSCDTEGSWNCLTTGYQRCLSGSWSSVVPMALGTKCYPTGASNSIDIGYADTMSSLTSTSTLTSASTSTTHSSTSSLSSFLSSSLSSTTTSSVETLNFSTGTQSESSAQRGSWSDSNAAMLGIGAILFVL